MGEDFPNMIPTAHNWNKTLTNGIAWNWKTFKQQGKQLSEKTVHRMDKNIFCLFDRGLIATIHEELKNSIEESL